MASSEVTKLDQSSDATPDRDGSESIDAFHSLLQDLQKQHDRDLAAVRAECLAFQKVEGQASQHALTQQHEDEGNGTLESVAPHSQESVPPISARSFTMNTAKGVVVLPSIRETTRCCGTPAACEFRRALAKAALDGVSYRKWPEWCGSHSSRSFSMRFDKILEQKNLVQPDEMVRRTMAITLDGLRQLMGVNSNCLLPPTCTQRAVWDILSLVFLAFDLIWIPMQVFDPEKGIAIRVLEIIILLYWTADIGLSFMTGYYKSGQLIMNFRSISRRYMTTWFAPDSFIVIIEWVLLIFPSGSRTSPAKSAGIGRIVKFLRVLRIARSLRLLRVIRLREVIYAMQERVDSEFLMIMLNMIQNLMGLLVISHYVACCWYLMGKSGEGSSWVTRYNIKSRCRGSVSKYLVSLNWSLAQFTPGGSYIYPDNDGERLFAAVVLLIAVLVGSTIISSITAAMTRLRSLQGNEMSRFFMLRKFLDQNHISRDLSTRLTRYIRLTVELQKQRMDRSKVDLLRLLSGPLIVELQTELMAPTLVGHQFFERYMEISRGATSELCHRGVRGEHYSKGDAIFHVSARAKEMFFVQRGSVYYRRLKGVRGVAPRSLLDIGNWASEGALWIETWVHLGTLRAVIESEVMSVSSIQFRETSSSYRDVFQYAKSYATMFLSQVDFELRNFGHTWDISQDLLQAQPHANPEEVLTEYAIRLREVVSEGLLVESSDSEYDEYESEVQAGTEMHMLAAASQARLRSTLDSI